MNYRDLFPEPPDPEAVPNCAEGGVLGVLPGIIGSMQANEVIKIAAGIGEPLAGRLFLFDAASFSTRVLKIPVNPSIEVKSLEALAEYCAAPAIDFKEISAIDYKAWLEKGAVHTLIDVRNPDEYDLHEMGGHLVPLNTIKNCLDQIPKSGKVVIHCKSGARSAKAIKLLQDEFGYHNLYNLKGGILAWERLLLLT